MTSAAVSCVIYPLRSQLFGSFFRDENRISSLSWNWLMKNKLWKVLGHYQSAIKLGMRSCVLHPKWNCYIITVEKGQNLKVLYRVYFWNFIWRIGNPWSLCHLCLWSHCLATIFVKKVISIVHDTFTVIWWSKCQAFFSLIIVIKKFNFLCKLTNLTLSILTPATFLNIVVIHSYIGISIWTNRLAFSKIWYWIS